MKCRLGVNEAVEIVKNDCSTFCEKNCPNQEIPCDVCGQEECMYGCEAHDLLGTCRKCDLCE